MSSGYVNVLDDFFDFHKKSYGIFIDSDKIEVRRFHEGRPESVFYDAVWGCAVLEVEDSNGTNEVSFFHIKGSRPSIKSDYALRVFFSDSQGEEVVVECDRSIVASTRVLRLNVYVRTDIGTMVVSVMPSLKKEAREVVARVLKNKKDSRLVQQLATSWLYEILN